MKGEGSVAPEAPGGSLSAEEAEATAEPVIARPRLCYSPCFSTPGELPNYY